MEKELGQLSATLHAVLAQRCGQESCESVQLALSVAAMVAAAHCNFAEFLQTHPYLLARY